MTRGQRITIIFLLFLPSNVLPSTWVVFEDGSGDAPSIQAALDLATSGDTILVYPGTYHENPQMVDLDDLILIGISGPEETIIDLGGGWSSFHIRRFEMSGLSFTNGQLFDLYSQYYNVHDCIFKYFECGYPAYGMNMFLAAWESLEYCYFENNIVANNVTIGSPIMVAEKAYTRGNLFSSNISYSDLPHDNMYSGIYQPTGSIARIEENRFVGNSADRGAIVIEYGHQFEELDIRNNIFYEPNWGCDIFYNGAPVGSIENNIFMRGNNMIVHYLYGSLSEPPKCNIIWDMEYDQTIFTEGNWNFNIDPRFCGAEISDFTVNVGSFCLPDNHPDGMDCGLIGIYGPGCPSPTKSTSWGRLKSIYDKK